MAKKVARMVKLQCEAGKATPAPPIGPALGQAGVNIMAFVKEFNERTAKQAGFIIPVETITTPNSGVGHFYTCYYRRDHFSRQGFPLGFFNKDSLP